MTKSFKMGHAVLLFFTLPMPFRGVTIEQSPASKVAEPEEVGVVYFQEDGGGLSPLEQLKVRKVFFDTGFEGLQEQWLIKGGKSAVRVPSTGKMLFAVRLAAGTDPSSFSLLTLKTHGRGRWLKGAPHSRNNRLMAPFQVTKFGESSYGLQPVGDLAPGEYAFAQNKSNQVYCFGVGDSGKKKKKHAENL